MPPYIFFPYSILGKESYDLKEKVFILPKLKDVDA